jgi:hypothetical protein
MSPPPKRKRVLVFLGGFQHDLERAVGTLVRRERGSTTAGAQVSGASADPPQRLLPPGAGEQLGADPPGGFFLFLVWMSVSAWMHPSGFFFLPSGLPVCCMNQFVESQFVYFFFAKESICGIPICDV